MSPWRHGCHQCGQSANLCRSHGARVIHCSHSLFPQFLHGVEMSLDLQRAARSMEHRLTAPMSALRHVLLSPDLRLDIHVRCENMFVGSHAPHTRVMGNVFAKSRFAICASPVSNSTSAPCPSGLSQKRARPSASRCCIVRISIAQTLFCSDSNCARP